MNRSDKSPPSSPSTNAATSLKAECLQRDGFRCVFSHIPDDESAEEGLVALPPGTTVMPTDPTHILPLALGKFNNANGVEREAVANVWYALYRYFPGLVGKIASDSLNQHRNLITLSISINYVFEGHRLAFDPIFNQPMAYTIHRLWKYRPLAEPPRDHEDIMTLVSSNNSFLLPEPEFFKTHYQITKILHISGIKEKINSEIRASKSDPEDINPDGSTDLGAILHRKMLLNI
ncbi:hypothetical protein LZ32DRAFT_628617 [Colletotrichum eremochloae]|nr:hypothetical protein LZ32DRAFT_628617 [Colletotrichum eremochloae]